MKQIHKFNYHFLLIFLKNYFYIICKFFLFVVFISFISKYLMTVEALKKIPSYLSI